MLLATRWLRDIDLQGSSVVVVTLVACHWEGASCHHFLGSWDAGDVLQHFIEPLPESSEPQ